MMLKGGPRTQILQTKRGLEELGMKVSLFETGQDLTKIDLLHLFGANIGTYHLAREIHKLGIPMVVSSIYYTRHSAPFVRSILAADSIVRKFARGTWTDYGIVAEICRWANVVLPNTKKEAKLLQKGLGISSEKIIVVPNGVDKRFYESAPTLFTQQYGIENFVLNVGHVGPERKNVLKLIRALERINAPAVIIGRKEDNEYGRKCLEEAKKNPRLLMLDNIPNDSPLLASAYAACDVFALPSQFETPGIAALEAGLAGAKIVITKYGGTEEYFGSHAEYVEPTSWELIHHGITTALNKEKSDILREFIRKEYLWEHVAQKTLEAYKLVLNRN
jgi:glycosyltransferase involved in cell wall biosynthesis